MSAYYKGKRSRNLYSSESNFRVSRSKLDLFINCPRCFYLDRKLGVGQPPGFPFNLNSAVDSLLKKEFDYFREQRKPHPLFEKFGIKAIPYKHEKLDEWRDSLRQGISYSVPDTNLILTGGVDDLWLNVDTNEIHIADYKATSKNGEVSLDADWQIGYKRQAEIYQWLFQRNGFEVSKIAYFVYCNGLTTRDRFDARLEFDIQILSYSGNSEWVEKSVIEAYQCLQSNELPNPRETCDFCTYVDAVGSVITQG